MVELREAFRQKDPVFFELLNCVRRGEVGEAEAALLQKRQGAPRAADKVPTKLYTHKVRADDQGDCLHAIVAASLDSLDRRKLPTCARTNPSFPMITQITPGGC